MNTDNFPAALDELLADDHGLGPFLGAPPSLLREGFDLPLINLSRRMAEFAAELVEAGCIEGTRFNGLDFVRARDLIHFTNGDFDPFDYVRT